MAKRLAGLIAALLIAAAAGGGVVLWWTRAPEGERAMVGSADSGALYQCPMHLQIVSHEPGKCPICQMQLQRVDEPAHAETAGTRRVLFYRHPMRPDVHSPVPTKDEMGMDYVAVYEEEPGGEASAVPGHAAFDLTSERQQLIGVTREPARVQALESTIRTVGRVAYDPALYRTVVEYREALRARNEIAGSALPEARRGADAILRAARLKLRQQGLSEAQVQQIAANGRDPVELLLPGDAVWIYAQVYEGEAPLVAPGQVMTIRVPSEPGRTFTAKVAAVDPILDPTTRTARVRALVPTPGASLRPESFVEVEIHVPLGERLAVPRSAVMDTGKQQIVFVVRGEGRFEPRSVSLGRQAGDLVEVLAGVSPGEEVVTSANFLIDSESRFRAALAAFQASPERRPE